MKTIKEIEVELKLNAKKMSMELKEVNERLQQVQFIQAVDTLAKIQQYMSEKK